MAGTWDIIAKPLREGSNFKRTITLKHKISNTPVDLTGCTVTMTLSINSHKIAINGITISDPPNGQISINYYIPDNVFNFGTNATITGKHQLDIRFPDNSVIPYLEGTVIIQARL